MMASGCFSECMFKDQTPLSNIFQVIGSQAQYEQVKLLAMYHSTNLTYLECTCIDINTENCLVHAASASDF